VILSGTRVRKALQEGEDLPEEFARREVAEILKRSAGGKKSPAGKDPENTGAHVAGRTDEPITRGDRESRNRNRGAVVWFTGLPASGKSTIAQELERKLFEIGVQVYLLDGDVIRKGLNRDLGFSPGDRTENIRRLAQLARLFQDAGMVTLTAFVSPFRKDRRSARELMNDGIFIEVYVKADVETCVKRDPKGMYRKAMEGVIPDFTGISSPYEEPEDPEIIVDTRTCSVGESVEKIFSYLKGKSIF
jgi:adenylylsulfate kinase